MKHIKEKIKKFGILEIIVLIIYTVLVFTIATNHECHEDEAQSWLIARDLNFIEIIKQMQYEGHSILWYYILAPFAKLGFPVVTQNYISCIFGILTIYLILKKSPFNKFTKILITFSGGMIFFYSVIARPYCLIPFLLVCISIIYKNKKHHPYLYAILISLLANTHLIMLPTAGMLTLLFWGEEFINIIKDRKTKHIDKKEITKLIASLLIVATSVFFYVSIAYITQSTWGLSDSETMERSISKYGDSLKVVCDSEIGYLCGKNILEIPLYFKILVGIVMWLCIIGTPQNIKQATVFWSQLIFTIVIHTFTWIMPARVYIVIYTLMFWAWNYKSDKQYNKNQKRNTFIEIALIALIVISAPSVYKLAYQDITGNFSTGKITAKYIEENLPEGSCIVNIDNQLQQSIIAYLPKDKYKFYLVSGKAFNTFITWDKGWNDLITNREIVDSIEKLSKENENIYIINFMNRIPPKMKEKNTEQIYNTQNKNIKNRYVRCEEYYIYKVSDK